MSQSATARNPFMLMLNPEVVLAAVEKSERLSQLNRHLCRPLDKQAANQATASTSADDGDDTDEMPADEADI